jgi:ribonucleotide monophosphatase NagD (HAD superfamily)
MSDVSMGVRLGAATVLVGTGYGIEEKASGEQAGIAPDVFLPGMREAAGWIVAHRSGT